ncbi:MAG: polysaccharide deacetylase family protein [Bacteroidota bacterium]|nr:polysaccharide deacetylase family protein [Ferruginibacter sp.]
MKKCIAFLITVSYFFLAQAQQKSVQELLGYPASTKLLIIHADDLGVSQSENAASIYAMEKGSINSGSIMVPCPWMGDMAAYARTHPTADLGLHLTLTSEWKNYKWGTVGAPNQTPALLNKLGHFYSATDSLYMYSNAAEVEKEIRAQIERAKQFGIDPTHFDAHMGCLFGTPEYLQILVRLGREYRVPVLLNREAFKVVFNLNLDKYISDKEVLVDKLYMAQPADFKTGMAAFYTNVMKSLQPGLSCILLHAAYDNAEMQAVTIDHPEYGAAWRQADFEFFSGEACRKLIKDEHIQLVTWREIRDKLVRGGGK